MDHAGSVREMVDLIKPEKVFCSAMAKKTLLAYNLPADYPYEVVKTGQSLSLGKKTVQFIETRMLHWPDSMFSYIPEDKLLISSDAFGEHWATSERFDDQVDHERTDGACRQILRQYPAAVFAAGRRNSWPTSRKWAWLST